MQETKPDFLTFISKLNEAGIRYVVTGSVATSIYGEPRLTHDVDLVLDIDFNSAEQLSVFFPMKDFYCPPLEVIKVEANRRQRGHFNLIHYISGLKADVYLCGEDELQRWALDNARSVSIGNEEVRLAPPEYVIIKKLQFYKEGGSEKHLRDIAGILRVATSNLDREFLDRYLHSFGLTDGWNRAKLLE